MPKTRATERPTLDSILLTKPRIAPAPTPPTPTNDVLCTKPNFARPCPHLVDAFMRDEIIKRFNASAAKICADLAKIQRDIAACAVGDRERLRVLADRMLQAETRLAHFKSAIDLAASEARNLRRSSSRAEIPEEVERARTEAQRLVALRDDQGLAFGVAS